MEDINKHCPNRICDVCDWHLELSCKKNAKETKRYIELSILKKLYKQVTKRYNDENISCIEPLRVIWETEIQAYIKERE